MEKASRDLDEVTSTKSMGSRDEPQRVMLVLIVAAWLATIVAVLVLQ